MLEYLKNNQGRHAPGVPAFDKLMELLERHPEAADKKSNGVTAFVVVPQGASFQTRLVDNVGKEVLFSWRTCLSKRGKTVKQNLLVAMREAIRPQVDAFRKSGTCALCGEYAALKDVHVDHKNSFKSLTEAFLRGRQAPTTFDTSNRGGAIFKEKDDSFKQDWIYFHRMFAELQLAHAKCNLTKR